MSVSWNDDALDNELVAELLAIGRVLRRHIASDFPTRPVGQQYCVA